MDKQESFEKHMEEFSQFLERYASQNVLMTIQHNPFSHARLLETHYYYTLGHKEEAQEVLRHKPVGESLPAKRMPKYNEPGWVCLDKECSDTYCKGH